MRLHLPKGLLAALLAACFALPAGATQYRWGDADPGTSTGAGPEKSTDGATWNRITYDTSHTLTNTDGSITFTDAGDYLITGIPEGGWNSGTSVVAPTVDGVAQKVASAWFSATESKRIYMTGENISKMSNIFLTGVHFVVGTEGTSSTAHTIASNLFLGAGAWSYTQDVDSVHHKAVLRANADTNITGDVTLTDSSAHISTFEGKDITFAGSLNGNGKSLSVGAQSAASVINLNGATNLGALTVGAKVDTSGSLSANGAAISVVIGDSATAEISNLTLLNESTLTNNGELTISGSYYGGSITQGDNGKLILSEGMSLNMDGMTAVFGSQKNDEQSGFQSYDATYTLVQGGSITNEGAEFRVAGVKFSGASLHNDVVKLTESRYNIANGATLALSTIKVDTNAPSEYYIHVAAGGTLTGVSDDSVYTGIAGSGALQIEAGKTLSYSTLTNKAGEFDGTLKFSGGNFKMDSPQGGNCSNAIELIDTTIIELGGNMTLSGALTAASEKTLSVIMAKGAASGELNIGTGSAEPGLAKVGKLDGATLQIGDGVTVNVSGRDGGNAQIAGAIVVNGGGTLKLTTKDTLGYDGGNFTDSITLQGSTDKTATLNLTATQTLKTSLILKGDTSITGEAMNSFGGSITVTGTNNIIGNEVQARKPLSISVENAGDSLQMSNITRSSDDYRAYSFTKKGAGLLTITGDVGASGRIIENATVEAGKMEVQGEFYGKLTQQGGETVLGGKSTITTMDCTGGSVEMKGADSSITTLTGSGTLKTSAGSADVTDASGFTGTLESTGGTLSAVCGTSLAAIKATGGSVLLNSSEASVSVAKIDVGTDGSVSVNGTGTDFKVSVADLVVGESGSRLLGHLDVIGSLSVQVGSNGQTGGLNMAYSGTNGDLPSGTLTLGSASGTGLELNLSYLPVMMEGDSLTLFKGVSAVQYYVIISAGTGETEATAVALSDPAPIDPTGDGIDASTVFSNVASGDFKLKFENNIVSLVAQRNLPEPTTATLSLLALMGLAARRRRKA